MQSESATENASPQRGFLERLIGAMLLDRSVFEEAENDQGALPQAGALVVLAGIARGLTAQTGSPAVEIAGSAIMGVLLWLVATTLVWSIGVRRFHYTSSYPELLRTLGFAAAPLLALSVAALPLGPAALPIAFAVHAWALLAGIVAVREALDVPTREALVVCVLSLAVALGVMFVFGSVLFASQSGSG